MKASKKYDAFLIERFESSMGDAADFLKEILADEEAEDFPARFLHAVYILSEAYKSDIATGGRAHGGSDE